MKKKNILITGGNGFIAKNLKEKLSQCKYNQIYATRQELDLYDKDKIVEFITNNKIDIIIHTSVYDAAPKCTKNDKSLVLEKNLKMFLNVIKHSHKVEKIIYFGSGAEYVRDK